MVDFLCTPIFITILNPVPVFSCAINILSEVDSLELPVLKSDDQIKFCEPLVVLDEPQSQ